MVGSLFGRWRWVCFGFRGDCAELDDEDKREGLPGFVFLGFGVGLLVAAVVVVVVVLDVGLEMRRSLSLLLLSSLLALSER